MIATKQNERSRKSSLHEIKFSLTNILAFYINVNMNVHINVNVC